MTLVHKKLEYNLLSVEDVVSSEEPRVVTKVASGVSRFAKKDVLLPPISLGHTVIETLNYARESTMYIRKESLIITDLQYTLGISKKEESFTATYTIFIHSPNRTHLQELTETLLQKFLDLSAIPHKDKQSYLRGIQMNWSMLLGDDISLKQEDRLAYFKHLKTLRHNIEHP